MIQTFFRKIFFRRRAKRKMEIDPDEVLLDARNLPQFDTHQFEGRMETAIPRLTLIVLFSCFIVIVLGFIFRIWYLQIYKGESYLVRSEQNSLRRTLIFPERGVVYDRNSRLLAWNIENSSDPDFSLRAYATSSGLAHVVGYLKYPLKDSSGIYYQSQYVGKDGVEKMFDAELSGQNGEKIIEADVLGNVVSESEVSQPVNGQSIILSVDARVSDKLYELIVDTARTYDYKGGVGALMDTHNGEVIALVSYPEYSQKVMTSGKDAGLIRNYLESASHPLLNRAVSGLYTPGSIIKPFVAAGVLDQRIIDPMKQILSTGSISVPNPYFPDKPSVFRDWKALGWVDMRHALSMSSDVYFYTVGGGFDGQKGIGIANIEKYAKIFGLADPTGINLPGEEIGIIPTPEWKKENFNGEEWRLGDTYNSAIGQYGFQITPLEILRAVAAIANDGYLVTPTILLNSDARGESSKLPLQDGDLQIIREGMRLAALEGTAKNLNLPFVKIAAKTGTAELGLSKLNVNSSVIGFFPYEDPRYAFVVIMEKGPASNTVGGVYVMSQLLDWMNINTPEYFISKDTARPLTPERSDGGRASP